MSKVSLVIPNFNRGHYLTACMESVLAQTHPEIEVIVVDDGSTDASREVLRGFANKIKLIEQDHRGAAAARNAGVEAAGGDFIAFLNSDDVIEPERISLQFAALEGNSEAGITFCDLKFLDAEGNRVGDIYNHDDFSRSTFLASMLERNRIGSSSAVMVRRAMLEKTGLFEEDIERKEDYGLWLRLLSIADVEYVPQPLVYVRVGTGRTIYGLDSLSGSHARALSHFTLIEIRRALAKKYTHPFMIQLAYARILLKIDQHAQLLHILGELLELKPGNFDARFLQGCYYIKSKNFNTALQNFERCQEIERDVPELLNNIGVCHAITGNKHDAAKAFRQATEMKSGYYDPVINLEILQGGGDIAWRPTLDRLRPKLFPATPISQVRPGH
ncbi:MAG TPA: glycosyltransferase [Acidobacteriota bacterium]|nr:glycosyltransferase [Acidobacteriota bacterium]